MALLTPCSGTCKRLWLLFHWFCSLCVRCVCAWFDLNVCDTLDVSSWHICFLDSGWVSLQNPLIWCNEVTIRRTCTVLLSSDTTETNDCLCAYVVDAPVLASYNLQIVSYQCPPHTHTQLLSALLYAQSMLRYVQETLITFHWFCSFCVRCVCAWFDLNVWDTLDVSSWHIYFLDSMWVSL